MSNEHILQKATELVNLIQVRKESEKKEKELKEYFKLVMDEKELDTMLVGDILISLTQKFRTDLDKDFLILKFGANEVKKCERLSTYIQVDVKKTSGFKKTNK